MQVCLYVIDHLVPAYGGAPDIMPLGARGTTEMLLNASRLFRTKGMDWLAYYNRTGSIQFPSGSVGTWNTNDHGVNNAEGALAWPAMDARLYGEAARPRDEMALALHMLETYQAQPNALFCADEVFCGRALPTESSTRLLRGRMRPHHCHARCMDRARLSARMLAFQRPCTPTECMVDSWHARTHHRRPTPRYGDVCSCRGDGVARASVCCAGRARAR